MGQRSALGKQFLRRRKLEATSPLVVNFKREGPRLFRERALLLFSLSCGAALFWRARDLSEPRVRLASTSSFCRKMFLAAPVAQLDRASAFGAEGWEFESLRAHQSHQILRQKMAQDFGCGLTLRSRPQNASSSSLSGGTTGSGFLRGLKTRRPESAENCAYSPRPTRRRRS